MSLLFQEPVLPFRRRNPAGLVLPEPPIPIGRNEVIEQVSDGPRQYKEPAAVSPRGVQVSGQSENRLTPGICLSVLHEHKTFHVFRGKAHLLKQLLSCIRLKGSEPDPTGPIMSEYEPYRTAAQIAYPIEQQHR